ncbi:DUF3291 domain-containing protein [Aminobacter aganoensis]|uniref:DUF3291 domain-containing protein n=1 Tax=Aminobacter aganoensis TaxID=83264 RepID=A0A7X0F5U7_9HYPH|nr:DUF3291 domain-containing protein [Aminobacter aganoensis]MBB6353691.1 hypothetical protein [Aminobacter aganoensis]
MTIAQMNWGRLTFSPEDPRLKDFMDSLDEVYRLAERHPGFLWRIPDEVIAQEIQASGFDNRMSATVSLWTSLDALHDYTYNSLHGVYLKRTSEWFEKVDGPQLVVWDVEDGNIRPSFREAWERLLALRESGPSARGYGWRT